MVSTYRKVKSKILHLKSKMKKMQAYKPGSVESYHLSSPDVAIRIHQPTHPDTCFRR
jgi:hypothetical protein